MAVRRLTELHALAAPHDGVVTQRDLVTAGFRPELASRQVARRSWQRLLPGVYLTRPNPPTLRQRCYAALRYAGPQALVSGQAGLVLHGVGNGTVLARELVVLVPHAVRRASTATCLVVRTSLPAAGGDAGRSGLAPLPLAPIGRCVADALRHAPDLSRARALGAAAMRTRTVNWDALVRMARRPGPGSGHLPRVVRELGDGVRSPAEADVHDTLRLAAIRGALPPYLLNPEVYLDGRLLGSPDAWFVGLGLGNEVDSRQWHEEEAALDRTLQRHDAFRSAGLHLNHVTPKGFSTEPAALVGRLAELVLERRALAVPEPAGLLVLARGPLLPARTPWPQVDPSRRW